VHIGKVRPITYIAIRENDLGAAAKSLFQKGLILKLGDGWVTFTRDVPGTPANATY
jgi:hypothetical protein